jgi:hypothetical protein
MHARRELWEVLLDLIPAAGSVLVDEVWSRAREQGLTNNQIGAALGYLCASDRARQYEARSGWSFVTRVTTRAAFPLVARPSQRAPRRLEGRR